MTLTFFETSPTVNTKTLKTASFVKAIKIQRIKKHILKEVHSVDYQKTRKTDRAAMAIETKIKQTRRTMQVLQRVRVCTTQPRSKPLKRHIPIAPPPLPAKKMYLILMNHKGYERIVSDFFFTLLEKNGHAPKYLIYISKFSSNYRDVKKYIQYITTSKEVSESSLQSSLLKYSATGYMFRAALCRLCVDLVDAEIALTKYEEMNPAFQESRERNLIKVLITHLEEQNVEAFTDTVRKYESISPFDQWCTTMLLRIKKTINAVDLC
ncbi:unnamed protein product, partial [Meganyctiphanes norvegica]